MADKTSREYLDRQNKASLDPQTDQRARKDLRSTERPYKDPREEDSAGHRGLTESDE